MIFASILLKVIGYQWLSTWRAAGVAAVVTSVVLDAVSLGRRQRDRPVMVLLAGRDALLLNLGCGVAGVFLLDVADWLLLRFKEGVPLLGWLVGALLNAFRIPVAHTGGVLHLPTMAGVLDLPVTYAHLGLPTLLLLLGLGAVYLLHLTRSRREILAAMAAYTVMVLAAGVLRLALSWALFLLACTFVDYKSSELPVRPFIDPRLVAFSYAALLSWFLPVWRLFAGTAQPPRAASAASTRAACREATVARPVISRAALACLGGMSLLLGVLFWKPEGSEKNGVMLIDTFHTHWSRTDRAYDKTWFGSASGYNYYCVKTLLSIFFDVSELPERLTAERLAGASILLIYDPDVAFTPEEIAAVREFVRRGGGLFLIGDHTNVFGSAAHLNSLCAPFGFTFRDDVLFDQKEDFFQIIFPGRASSFLLKGIDVFKFRGPCSIRPTSFLTSPVMAIDHSKARRAIYCVNNFYPRPADDPAMQAGRFAVATASSYGLGRVFAFGDSTLFSEFEIFYPGKYELLVNVVNWLNHRDPVPLGWPRRLAAVGAVLLLGIAVVKCGDVRRTLALVAAGIVLFYGAGHAANQWRRHVTTLPDPRRPARFLFFVADENDTRWSLRMFYSQDDYSERYDIFAQWVLRNGLFPAFYLTGSTRQRDLYELTSQARRIETGLAFVLSNRSRLELLDRVDRRLLTGADRLMFMAGTGVDREALTGALLARGCFSAEDLQRAVPVAGVEDTLLIQRQGRRILLVFSAVRFSDKHMGITEKVIPNTVQKELYEREYAILDALFARR